MKKRIISCLLACLLLAGGINAKIRVLTIGDSTMANYDELRNSGDNELRGWGQMLSLFFNEEVTVQNAAKNGRSSKSFYYEFWEKLRETLHPGDYVVIQFGHNDEKNNGDDSPEKDGRGTAPWGQFHEYLTRYVNEIRSKGATPVLATPIVRRMFDNDGKTLSARGRHNLQEMRESTDSVQYDYVLAMKDVARKMNVLLVDMTQLTAEIVQELGATKAKEIIYCNKDNTHLKALGALRYAELFAQDLKRQGILTTYLSFSNQVIPSPLEYDFGNVFVGEPALKVLSLTGDKISKPQEVHLKVQPPFALSLFPDKNFSEQLDIHSTGGYFYQPVYIRFVPEGGLRYDVKAVLNMGADRHAVSLTGIGIAADRTKPFSLEYSDTAGLKSSAVAQINSRLEGLRFVADNGRNLLTTLHGSWPSDEIDVNSNRYIEWSVTAEQDVYLSSLSYTLSSQGGDAMQFSALGAMESTFATPDTYSLMENLRETPQNFTQKIILKLSKGQTYYFRIYPWSKNGGEHRFVNVKSVVFSGFQTR